MAPTANSPRKKYKQPPIQEAICEIHLTLPRPIDDEALAKIGKNLKADLPLQQTVEEKTLSVVMALDTARTTEQVIGKKLIARSFDKRDLVQVGYSSFAVNRLSPYEGWEELFRGRIISRFKQLREVSQVDGLSRVGIRYINRITLPSRNYSWSEWFSVNLPLPDPLAGRENVFQSHSEFALGDGIRVMVNFGSFPEPTREPTVLLDIDVIWEGKTEADSIETMLDKVHTPHTVIFESYLKDSLRNLFVPIN